MKTLDKNLFTTNYQSPLGLITMASDGTNLVGLWINGQTNFLNKHKDSFIKNNDLEIFNLTKLWLNDYFAGKNPTIKNIPLSLSGSDFELIVFKLLLNIPYGKTASYKELATQVAQILGKQKMSAQAIGSAVKKNPVSIIVPCHRVIGINGTLVGYAGGLSLKQKLLDLENAKYKK